MAFESFWRADRQRRERERQRQRSAGDEWRDERRERGFGHRREDERESAPYGESPGEPWRGGSERGWSPGGDYYGDRSWDSEGEQHGDRYRGGARQHENTADSPGVHGAESQQYRGRGPRGYRRSDERIREDVCDALTEDAYIDASNMEVTVKECEVTLCGSVSSREQKRRAEDLAECISGVRDVHNQLRVSAEQRTEGASMPGESARPHH